jgi:hypothetical protein
MSFSTTVDKLRVFVNPVLSAIGIFISIIGLLRSDTLSKFVFQILISSYVIVLISCSITAVAVYKRKMEGIKNLDKIKEKDTRLLEKDDIIKNLIDFDYNLHKKTNLTVANIMFKVDSFRNSLEPLFIKAKNHQLIPDDDILDSDKKIAYLIIDDFINEIIRIYRDYTQDIITDTKNIIQEYLKNKGYQYSVSISLKLYNRILKNFKSDIKEIIVYTAMRDSDSPQEREIGKDDYTINGNTDFFTCLKQGYYINNNAKRSKGDYMNEHSDFDRYYNCTVTVPIFMDFPETQRRFGYFCCDLLKDSDVEIFDPSVANILSSSAINIAYLFDHIYSIWLNFSVIQKKIKVMILIWNFIQLSSTIGKF